MFKRRRNKETNDRNENEDRRAEKENRRSEKGSGEDLSTPTDSHNLYEEECTGLLKELLELSSKEASLTFELFQLLEEAKIETIRLSGLIASCKLEDRELAGELYKEFEKMFSKYVKKGE